MPNPQECVQRAMALLEAADEIEQVRHTIPDAPRDVTGTLQLHVGVARNMVDADQKDNILDMASSALVYAEDYDTHAVGLRSVKDKLDVALGVAHDEISLFALQQLLNCAGRPADTTTGPSEAEIQRREHFAIGQYD